MNIWKGSKAHIDMVQRLSFFLFAGMAVVLLMAAVPLCAQSSSSDRESAGMAAEREGRLREALNEYLAALHTLPDPAPASAEQRLEERIIKVVLQLDPPPAVPEEAERRMTRGKTALRIAQGPNDLNAAASEFRQALRVAPWVAGYYFNLALVLEKQKNYADAIRNFKLYVLAAPKMSDLEAVRQKIVELQYLQERIVIHRIETAVRSRYSVPPRVDVAVSAPEASDIPEYDKLIVTFTDGTKKTTFEFLISKDRQTLARLEKMDISEDLMSKIDIGSRPIRGNRQAKITIVSFDDFQCPFCSQMHEILFPRILKAYGNNVRVIYKDYPLVEIHPWAMHAAIDANCLGAQSNDAYWDFADYVHSHQKQVGGQDGAEAIHNLERAAMEQGTNHGLDHEKIKSCIEKQDELEVRASMAQGDKLGVDSTPTLFINGEKFSGVMPEGQMRAVLDRLLARSAASASSSNDKK